jgi:hypothetical protein
MGSRFRIHEWETETLLIQGMAHAQYYRNATGMHRIEARRRRVGIEHLDELIGRKPLDDERSWRSS